nr:GIY-YIG nuclease family protein [Mesorhizobium sp. B2-6-2]
MWYVYFLQLHNGDVYVGSTNDLRRRFESHQSGQVTSTKAYLPVALRAISRSKPRATPGSSSNISRPDLKGLRQQTVLADRAVATDQGIISLK